jgi:hypothetical protein
MATGDLAPVRFTFDTSGSGLAFSCRHRLTDYLLAWGSIVYGPVISFTVSWASTTPTALDRLALPLTTDRYGWHAAHSGPVFYLTATILRPQRLKLAMSITGNQRVREHCSDLTWALCRLIEFVPMEPAVHEGFLIADDLSNPSTD